MNAKPNPRHERMATSMLKAKLGAGKARPSAMHEGVTLSKPGSHTALLRKLFTSGSKKGKADASDCE